MLADLRLKLDKLLFIRIANAPLSLLFLTVTENITIVSYFSVLGDIYKTILKSNILKKYKRTIICRQLV